MRRFVLDCSVTMAWCFSDESDDYAEAVLGSFVHGEALVPALWPLEVANVLLVAERRHRLTEAQAMRFVDLLGALPITVDKDTPDYALGSVLLIAREHHLSSYDAAYLELAMRAGLPLASRDTTLTKAARRCGARLVTSRDLTK